VARALPEAVYWAIAAATLGLILAARGEIQAAEDEVSRLSDNPLHQMFAQIALAAVDIERGLFDSARQRLEPVVPLFSAVDSDYALSQAYSLLAAVEALSGRPEAALAAIDRARSVDLAVYSHNGSDLCLFAAFACFLRADEAGVATARDAAAEHARVATGPLPSAVATAASGLLARLRNEPSEAHEHFETAAHLFERAPRAALAAHAFVLAAESAADAGADPAPLLKRADELCGRFALTRVGALADELRDRLSTRAPKQAALHALTPRELDTLRLVGAGMSNREIAATLYLSEHTVRNYLSRTFTKLGLVRRSQVAALLTDTAEGTPQNR
jgi:DNA-binding CsgD family transcriptional regulator